MDHRESKGIPEKHYFCFTDYAKALTVWTTTNWKILKEMGIPDHLTCLLKNPYAGQETTVRTRHATMDWFKIGKGVCQGCILSPCLFNLYAESVQFSHSVVSNSLWPHGLQHGRFPCPSPTPRACSNARPLSRWCHPTISFSVVSFFSCLQSFSASWSFPMSQFFTSGGQSIGVSASASMLSMNIQDWFLLVWTSWISLQSKDSQQSSPTPQFKSINSSALSFLYAEYIMLNAGLNESQLKSRLPGETSTASDMQMTPP